MNYGCEYITIEYRLQRSTREHHENMLCLVTHEPCLIDSQADRQGCTRRIFANMSETAVPFPTPPPPEGTQKPLL
jgi:hypothetical protein